ncbi:hypothetical protein PIB30_008141 [Stylosanthes scabra]|uniref:Uncharacterized protein n=1 Tax=Stylosanthes scabra TaxID=79078 RepID=A0ABU6Y2X3_9FABA|nr:hypothetical protein [Stylosanthes scabra]
MDQEMDTLIFNMGSLGTTFPQKKRGLSRYYSGKSRSFTCIADVHSVEDLKKPEHPDAKKRKKHSQAHLNLPPYYPCRRAPSCTQLTTPYVTP